MAKQEPYFNLGPRPSKEEAERRETLRRFRQGSFLTDDPEELVDRMNLFVAVTTIAGHHKIMFDSGPDLVFVSPAEAKLKLAQYQLLSYKDDGTPKFTPGFSILCTHPNRREYDRVVFDPTLSNDDTEYNRFTGWNARPFKGDCGLLYEHVLENICQGDTVQEDFLWDWVAQIIQDPGHKSGVALVLRGEMGTGKSMFVELLRELIGESYCPVVDSPELLTGRFNGHMEPAILVCSEESVYAGDPRSVSRLRQLITSEAIMIEHKGLGAYMAPSYCRVIMTTNADHCVPAAPGERRYAIYNVGSGRKQDGAYFKAIIQQWKAGGRNALMYDLVHRDISRRDFSKPPMNDALVAQIRKGFTAEDRWLETFLTEGAVQFRDGGSINTIQWHDETAPLEVLKDDLLKSYQDHVPGFRSPPTAQSMGTYLAKTLPSVSQAKKGSGTMRQRYVILPSLEIARAEFVAARPGYVFSKDDIQEDGGLQQAA